MNHLALILHNPAPFWGRWVWNRKHGYEVWRFKELMDRAVENTLTDPKFVQSCVNYLNAPSVLLKKVGKKRRYRLKGKRATIPVRWEVNPRSLSPQDVKAAKVGQILLDRT